MNKIKIGDLVRVRDDNETRKHLKNAFPTVDVRKVLGVPNKETWYRGEETITTYLSARTVGPQGWITLEPQHTLLYIQHLVSPSHRSHTEPRRHYHFFLFHKITLMWLVTGFDINEFFQKATYND